MVPIMNVPFLARTMERLYEAGIRDVILPAGYMPQAIVDYFGDGSSARHEDHVRHRGNAARHGRRAQERRGAHHRSVLRAQRRHSHEPRSARDAALPRAERRTRRRCISSASRIRRRSVASCTTKTAGSRRSSRSRRKVQEPTNEINAGTYLARARDPRRDSRRAQRLDRARDVSGRSSRAAKRSTHTRRSDYWIDLGRPEHYLAAHRDMLAGAMPLALEPGISGERRRRAARASGRHVRRSTPTPTSRVDPSAKVGPNVVLGRGCSIGADAVVRDSRPVGARERRRPARSSTRQSSRAASRSGRGPASGAGTVIGHDVNRRSPGKCSSPAAASVPAARIAGLASGFRFTHRIRAGNLGVTDTDDWRRLSLNAAAARPFPRLLSAARMRDRDLHEGHGRLRTTAPSAFRSRRGRDRRARRRGAPLPARSRRAHLQNKIATVTYRVADFVNRHPGDLLNIQHEYGLFGGERGEWLVDLHRRCREARRRDAAHRAARTRRDDAARHARALCERQRASSSLSETGRGSARTRLRHRSASVCASSITASPTCRSTTPIAAKASFGIGQRTVISTFGLINRGKGLEYAIEAMRDVVKRHPEALYLILGRDASGRAPPRRRIVSRIAAGDGARVRLAIQRAARRQAISISTNWSATSQATDIYLTPYLNPVQIVSGTLAYAVGCGKAIVSTPYLYAQELLAHNRGFLVRIPRRAPRSRARHHAARRSGAAPRDRAPRLPLRPADDVAARRPRVRQSLCSSSARRASCRLVTSA